MMNTRNLGLKESVGVKYKDGIFGELCLKLATVKRQSFKQSLSRVSSEALYEDVLQNRPFCNIHRKVPVLESLFNKFADLRPEKGTSTQVFSC